MLIACLIGIRLCNSENTVTNFIPYRRFDAKKNPTNNDLRYFIHFLDARYNDLWLFSLLKKTLSNQLMAAEIKLASALNRHQVRQLCYIKRDDLLRHVW